ncbi:hypothetical protein C7S18_04770 [Ahniella affigens]|uniref:Uncharacterized protein n=2 Tax=Ahniella affigens TaxID=2021234 RepID=A0A2P1PNX8_9GAMM|nr:hypothetical protein C7S18_04770 [Ahniella affigens]
MPSAAVGHQAVFKLLRQVYVHDSRGIHYYQELSRHDFTVQGTTLELPLPETIEPRFAYRGDDVSIRLMARLEVDDGVLFDTTADAEIELPELPRTAAHSPASNDLIEPKDHYSLGANIAAIPLRNKILVLGLLVIGGLLALVNAAIGVHDELVPEAATVFYDHHGSDGSESPIMKSLAGSGGLSVTLWLIIRAQLRRYMHIKMKDGQQLPYRGLTVSIGDMLEGVSRVPLEKITIRVVAVNLEKGQYKRGSGTKERTISFSTPKHGVILFEQFIPYVPARMPLQHYVQGYVDFTPMFDCLYPPIDASSSHGLAVDWEVQLLHPLFVDQELKGKAAGIDWREFYRNEPE